ncbi:uncharacterized protein LOC115229494 [Octopus sinensis]|uniref:Uncharacterized protein LOC115229494 n=1 Tax=Octopus sinensis TaxID=2607531 RepID=A0A6P7U0E8_9MOLL|nr:uncharacterized protein LOC115229494 [Octopus sinensis]
MADNSEEYNFRFDHKMECQVDKTEHFRHHLLFAFNRGVKVAEATLEICAVFGEKGQCLRVLPAFGFHASKMGILTPKNGSNSGRPTEFDEERLNQLLHENPHQSTRE